MVGQQYQLEGVVKEGENQIFRKGETSSQFNTIYDKRSFLERKSKTFELAVERELSGEELMGLMERMQRAANDYLQQNFLARRNGSYPSYSLLINIQMGLREPQYRLKP